MNSLHLHLGDTVAAALRDGRAVVALESTIFTHGMPHPRNIETALEVEAIVRSEGAVPATIGVIGGRLIVGLTPQEITALGSEKGPVFKAAAKDLAFVLASGQNGGTTVSATMLCAHLAGIRVFATGGIGGVHREAESTFDISSDLLQFATTPVAVVSAGCKSILDIPKTLEYLETIGVPVIGFETDDFPAFHSRTSGETLALSTSELAIIAKAYRLDRKMDRTNGILVANPIPREFEIPQAEIGAWITTALLELKKASVRGKEVTPFLLSAIGKLSGGRALEANIALVKHNARIAARLAKLLVD
jgi:pseudouridine-5'-phosphate glycosidase